MSTVRIEFRPPLAFIERQQGHFRRLLEDLHPLWDRFLPVIAAFERDWFESHGKGAWPALADSTLDRKRAAGYTLEPLRTDDRQGSLYDTLTDPQLAAEVGRTRMEWSTGVPYAGYHQEGGAVAGRPPKRQVIPDPLPVEYRRQLEHATVSWINQAAADAFGSVR